MAVFVGWKQFLHPHYITNVFLGIIFYLLKSISPFCDTLFEDCKLNIREWELLTFLGCIIVMKNRKQASTKMYISTVCMFAKILSTFLFVSQSPIMGAAYVTVCILHLAFLPEPAYAGPDLVTYFAGDSMEDEIQRDKRVTWLIEFYAAWSPNCVNFAQIYAELSAKYTLDNLKFGKLDVTRFSDVAKKYKVDCSSWSKQLPTVIMFQGGKDSRRRPAVNDKGKLLHKFIFSADNMVRDFELAEVYNLCKKTLPKKSRKSDLNKTEDAAKVADTNKEKAE